jgi:NAD(P)-dependent dehydrogenase (short-subunit alcohol dehydrogenase family)
MQGRVALITGASSGIGRATALILASEGAAVALVALPGAELEAAAQECRAAGAETVAHAADVGDSGAVAAMFTEIEHHLGPIDAVFNNAGISIVAPITDTTDEQWQRLLHTNLTGNFLVSREAARTMVTQGRGAIVSTASELALIGEAGYAGYTATKGAILAMTRALAAELAPYVPVPSTPPCWTATTRPRMTRRRRGSKARGRSRRVVSGAPRRWRAWSCSSSPMRRAS